MWPGVRGCVLNGECFGLSRIAFRIGVEGLFAGVGAEVISFSLIQAFPSGFLCFLGGDLHPADGVLLQRCTGTGGDKLHLALRIEKEISGKHDALPDSEPFFNFNDVAQAAARGDRARFKRPLSVGHKNRFPDSCIENGIGGDKNARGKGDGQFDIDKHIRPEEKSGICGFQSQLQSSGCRIELRENAADSCGQAFVLTGQRDADCFPGLKPEGVVFIKVGDDPDPGEIRNRIKGRSFIKPQALRHIALQDKSRPRCPDLNVFIPIAVFRDLIDLRVRHAQSTQGVPVLLGDFYRTGKLLNFFAIGEPIAVLGEHGV